MKEAISRLYAHIILFFQQAVKWYSMSSAGRAISSIFKPFELDYKDTVEEIKLCSQTVNNIASAASRAELRDLHDIIKEQYTQDKERDKKLQQMQTELKSLQEKMVCSTTRILQAGTSKYCSSSLCHTLTLWYRSPIDHREHTCRSTEDQSKLTRHPVLEHCSDITT